MSNWNFEPPTSDEPGEYVYALVVYTGNHEVGVRCMERASVLEKFNSHVFAWMPITYPLFNIFDLEKVVDNYRNANQPRQLKPAKFEKQPRPLSSQNKSSLSPTQPCEDF